MSQMSSQLFEESKKYKKGADKLYKSALFRKYLPWAVLVVVILLVFFFRRLYS